MAPGAAASANCRQLAAMAPRSMVRTASVAAMALMRLVEVAEPGEFGLEEQRDGAGRAVPLLGDDEVGLVVDLLHPLLPLVQRFLELVLGLVADLLRGALGLVVFVAIDEHHHVGVLLDRAGFAQIRQLRTLV